MTILAKHAKGCVKIKLICTIAPIKEGERRRKKKHIKNSREYNSLSKTKVRRRKNNLGQFVMLDSLCGTKIVNNTSH